VTKNERADELHATMRPRPLRTPLRFTDANLPTIEHRIFGRVWAPQNMGELSALLDHFGWASQGGWRGQGDIDWYLDSTAVRRIHVPRPEDDLVGVPADYLERRVREYERDLLARARLAGHGRRDGRDLHDLELLAVLRHHGAATRLIDFTRNVWVALWFACREVPDRFGLLVGLNLGGAFGISDEATLARPYEELLDDAGARLSLWRPSALSPRISAQQAFFLWGPAAYRPWGSLGEPSSLAAGQQALELLHPAEPEPSRAVPGLLCIAIAPELKSELSLHWSSLFGYEEATMFPDLDGFAQANGVFAPIEVVVDDEDHDVWAEDDEEEPTEEEF